MYSRAFSSLSLVLSLFVLVACQKQGSDEIPQNNLVTSDSAEGPRTIGENGAPYIVQRGEDAQADLAKKAALPVTDPEAQKFLDAIKFGNVAVDPAAAGSQAAPDLTRPGNLVLGFPVGLLGEAQVFGGVITKVSKGDSENLGRLKLIDLTPLHVRPVVVENPDKTYDLSLVGCASNCKEGSNPARLVDIPIVGVKPAENTLLVDLAVLGDELNLVEMLDPKGDYTKLKTKTSKVVLFDYSVSTLVFDVEVTMVPIDAAAPQEEVKFTARWYLRLGSVFHSEFVSRPETPGVGYFMTERVAEPKIQRHNLTPLIPGQAPVKYFIKNVPKEYQASFAKAFDEWNATFTGQTGKALLRYEFVDATDPKAKLLVAGDPRYNIIEWDLDNLAPYGGLGPSIANQHTGEILTSNILVQGPKIVELYKNWFKTAEVARVLQSEGLDEEAMTLLRDHAREIDAKLADLKALPKFEMSLGKLAMRVPAQMPALEDPLFARDDFELLPPNMTYEQYMEGYFLELVGHEMGHNLGLRHNFRGNLSAASPIALGKVSSSIMEYLGRGFRYLNGIGPYDLMAVGYGYAGKAPTVLNGFCTDENVAEAAQKGNSPECSRDDATHDPYSFFESRLVRAVALLANPGKPTASTWKVDDLATPLQTAVQGMGLYAATAATTATKWTNFFVGPDRPMFASGVKAYVVKTLKARVCDPKLVTAVAEKATPADQKVTADLIVALRTKVAGVLKDMGIAAADIACP